MLSLFMFALVIVGLWSAPAYGYLDPGTGSMIIQAIIAAIVGGLFAIKTYWQRLRGFFGKWFGKDES